MTVMDVFLLNFKASMLVFSVIGGKGVQYSWNSTFPIFRKAKRM